MDVGDILKKFDWPKILGVLATWFASNPNVYTWALQAAFTVFTTARKAMGMTEAEAKEALAKEIAELKERPLLPMDFDV